MEDNQGVPAPNNFNSPAMATQIAERQQLYGSHIHDINRLIPSYSLYQSSLYHNFYLSYFLFNEAGNNYQQPKRQIQIIDVDATPDQKPQNQIINEQKQSNQKYYHKNNQEIHFYDPYRAPLFHRSKAKNKTPTYHQIIIENNQISELKALQDETQKKKIQKKAEQNKTLKKALKLKEKNQKIIKKYSKWRPLSIINNDDTFIILKCFRKRKSKESQELSQKYQNKQQVKQNLTDNIHDSKQKLINNFKFKRYHKKIERIKERKKQMKKIEKQRLSSWLQIQLNPTKLKEDNQIQQIRAELPQFYKTEQRNSVYFIDMISKKKLSLMQREIAYNPIND